MMKVPTPRSSTHPGGPRVRSLRSAPVSVVADTIVRTVELGVTITDAAVAGETTVVWCDLLTDGPGRCPGCGIAGIYRDTVERRVTDVPVAGHPLQLRVRVPRYRCVHDGCAREVFAHDTSRLARPGWSTTRRCAQFVLRRLMLDRTTVAAVARELGRSPGTPSTPSPSPPPASCCWSPALPACEGCGSSGSTSTSGPIPAPPSGRVRHRDHRPHRCRGRSRRGTAARPGRGPVSGGDEDWLAARDQAFRDQVQIVAMDGFGGYKNAATEALPDAVTVMDPFHVVALAGAKLDLCRQRVQQDTLGHRGRSGDPLYRVRRTLRTRLALLTDRQRTRLEAVFAAEEHVAVEVTWWAYQQIIAAYADQDRQRGKALLTSVIDTLRAAVPAGLEELATLGRTLHRRRDDVLAYFTHRASNGPTEAINGRLEALRRNALGLPQPDQLPHPVAAALRIPRTLIPEEPLSGGPSVVGVRCGCGRVRGVGRPRRRGDGHVRCASAGRPGSCGRARGGWDGSWHPW